MLFEKYRPQYFKELVSREKQIKAIQNLIDKDEPIPHLFLFGPPGTGKTTFAKVVATEIYGKRAKDLGFGSNFFEFNASSDRGIDFIRKDIIEIAKRRPFGVPYKIVVMDEADHITPDAQACFRRVLEQYQNTTRFIFTANYPYRIIPALHSRFLSLEFPVIAVKDIAKRLKYIAKHENLDWSDQELISMAKESNGDLRKAIGMLEGESIDTETARIFENLTIKKLADMSAKERVQLAFEGEAETVFIKLWEMVQREKAWDKLEPMCACNYKMNMSVHKTMFIAFMLEKHFGKRK